MLEIIALCSCACLACLWCALAFEVARNRCGTHNKWIFGKPCGWKCSKICRGYITGQAQSSPCKNPFCTSPSYKYVCKMCRRVKPECICAKLICHGMAINHFTKNQFPDASIRNISFPNFPRETYQPSPNQIAPCPRCAIFSRDTKENHYGGMNQNCTQQRSLCKQIAEKKRKKKKNKDSKK